MLSAAVSAKSAVPPPVLMSVTSPVASKAKKHIAIGKSGLLFACAKSSASAPKKTITAAAAYLAKYCGIKSRQPSAAPAAL